MTAPPRIAGLYAIADTQYLDDARLLPAVTQAIAGGARLIQYRDKKHGAADRARQATKLATLCRRHDVLFIINDDAELAQQVQAHGVHLGQGDISLAQARAQLGQTAIIGISCYNELARGVQAQGGGADYVAFGSFFASRTKPQAVRAGLELLAAAKQRLRIPVVAIGGISPENGAHLVAAGADALAVIEGVFGQTDVRAAARRYTELFTRDKTCL
jgi:thiamine-phosphate pyrophosphorylase